MAGTVKSPHYVELKNSENKYHNISCCDWTRGADNLIGRYFQDGEEVVDLAMTDPETLVKTIWKLDGPLAIDNSCRCLMGQGDIRSFFSCAQCKNLRRLVDFKMQVIDRPFHILCGEYTGTCLLINKHNLDKLYLQWDHQAVIKAQSYILQYQNLKSCGTPDIDPSNFRCIVGDAFTVGTIVWWMAFRLLREQELNHICPLYNAFVCRNTGYSIVEVPSIGTIDKLVTIEEYILPVESDTVLNKIKIRPDIVRSIIYQLVITLTELTKMNFSHGTPSSCCLVFNDEPVSYMYDKVHIDSEITLQLTNMWTSSGSIIGNLVPTHLYSQEIASSMHLQKSVFVPEISTRYSENVTSEICSDNPLYYRLTSNTIDIYHALQHIGFPLYVGTFDFYCFMTSMMCNEEFYYTVMEDKEIKGLWYKMWLEEDVERINYAVMQRHGKENKEVISMDIRCRIKSEDVIDIIRGSWLRCGVLKCMWEGIKQLEVKNRSNEMEDFGDI